MTPPDAAGADAARRAGSGDVVSTRAGAPHDADGFHNPWPGGDREAGFADFLRWRLQRLRDGGGPDAPPPGSLPRATPDPARPRTRPGELRVTWVGQATFLIQLDGFNLLTDPVFSDRASPFSWAGPKRLVPPGLALADLPPLDAVLVSHDHYDHLDARSVGALHERFGDDLTWFAPLGFAAWFERSGIRRVAELDWWQPATLAAARPASAPGAASSAGESEPATSPDPGPLVLHALPAQHWCRRSPRDTGDRLWCSWAAVGPAGTRVYFAGDSGYCTGFREIGDALGPFDAALLPIGAYEPRWFMKPAHMNPDDALDAYADLGGAGAFVGMHWGTFVLTDEPVTEPPERARAGWQERGLPDSDLWVLRHGETRSRYVTQREDEQGRGAGT